MAAPVLRERDGRLTLENGHRLYYRVVGDGPLTVAVPGASWWGRQADCLASEHTLVLYDTRGRGRSDPLTTELPLGLEVDVADLDALRIELQVERLALMGWSYLGGVVALYAATHPDRVERIVQVGAIGLSRKPYWDQWMTNYSERAAKFAESERAQSVVLQQPASEGTDAASEIRAGLRATILPQLGRTAGADAILDAVGTDLPNEHPAALAKWFERNMASLGNWDLRPQASKVLVPVLTVHGTEDNVPIEASREWVSVLPDARLLRLAGLGHYPFYESPQEFFGPVGEFLAGRWPAAAEPLMRGAGV